MSSHKKKQRVIFFLDYFLPDDGRSHAFLIVNYEKLKNSRSSKPVFFRIYVLNWEIELQTFFSGKNQLKCWKLMGSRGFFSNQDRQKY